MEDLFHYVLAILHDADYRATNAGALSAWSGRVFACRTGRTAAPRKTSQALAEKAAGGSELATLLDPDTLVPGVTAAATAS